MLVWLFLLKYNAHRRQPRVVELKAINEDINASITFAIRLFATGSEHPLARAVLDKAQQLSIKASPVTEFKTLAGRGITGRIDSAFLYLGNSRLMQELGVDISSVATATQD
ncbi:MAG: hypothetical protein IPP76_02155 [Moraxellaceae bacterium]|nr:hypothetical protein [Moraxellaceae bacterium]